jgi:hypothetical protein
MLAVIGSQSVQWGPKGFGAKHLNFAIAADGWYFCVSSPEQASGRFLPWVWKTVGF